MFLQFDGMTDDVHRTLRGRPLARLKQRAIERCAAAELPVVLVPTVAAGVNDGQLGGIVRFAMRNSPTVRGVHFQPLARFGRVRGVPEGRVSLPAVLAALESETAGMVSTGHFRGGSIESPWCSFSASYRIVGDALEHIPWAKPSRCSPPLLDDGVQWARAANAVRWGNGFADLDEAAEPGSLDAFIAESRRRAFSITGMAFMDADTLDLEQLARCHIFIMGNDGVLVPFCAYNLTGRDGTGPHRQPMADRATKEGFAHG